MYTLTNSITIRTNNSEKKIRNKGRDACHSYYVNVFLAETKATALNYFYTNYYAIIFNMFFLSCKKLNE